MLKKAIIIGSTGLIGKSLIELLLQSNEFGEVIALVRKPTNAKNKKVKFIETDFKDLSLIEQYLNGDVLFICIGSTMAKAGSKEAFLKIDYNIPVDVAHLAKEKGVKSCVVVSSLGADAESANFYLQTKGKMEQAIEKLSFQSTSIMRPSILFGDREEFRLGELFGKFFMKLMGPFFLGPLKKYRGIQAKTVAQAMINSSLNTYSGLKNYESNEIEIIAHEKS